MWPIPPINNTFVTISFHPHRISCCLFKQAATHHPIELKDYQTHKLDGCELEHLIIFNPSHIGKFIADFLKKNNLQTAFALFCLRGPCVTEQMVTLETAVPQPDQINLPQYNHLIWDYVYLYPTKNDRYMFYVAGIKREQLFQYQLLALKNNLNLVAISPSTTAFLGLYKHSKADQFRQSQLGLELEQHNHRVEQLLDESLIDQMVTIDPSLSIDTTNEARHLLPALGLFLMRNRSHA